MSPDTIPVDSIFEYGDSPITQQEMDEGIGYAVAQYHFDHNFPINNPYESGTDKWRGYDHFVKHHVPALVREQV